MNWQKLVGIALGSFTIISICATCIIFLIRCTH